MRTKGDVIIGFCWYLHFLVEKQSKDPEVLRCGQEPDVIAPRKPAQSPVAGRIQH